MSFRGRLTLFFLLIVVLPMVTVAVLVVQVTGSSRSGKADARVAAGLETGLSVYADRLQDARQAAGEAASEPGLGPALEGRDEARLGAIAADATRRLDLSAIVIKGASGNVLATAGGNHPFAAAKVLLNRKAGGGSLGSIQVSTTTPAAFLDEVRRLTRRQGAVLDAKGKTIAATVPLDGITPPASGHSKGVEVQGDQLRAATADLPGAGGFRIVLLGPEESGGFLASSPLVVAVLVVFFGVAFVFVAMLLRALQGQVAAMLGAARRIGEGDFSRKVPVVGQDEMAGLASEFNKMSDRLAEQMQELRRQRDIIDRSVQRIGEASASGFDREATLQILVETAIEGCGADYGRIAAAGAEEAAAEAGTAPTGALRQAVRAAEEHAVRDANAVEARRDFAHALASNLRPMGDGAGTTGVMTVARMGEPFSAGDREVFLYLVGQASASIENVALHELVSAQAVTDELTGIANNRRFREWIENEAARATRFGHELSLLMLDLDDFKQINDKHGHLQGDEVLRVVGEILREESRGVDEPARYGGEEFVVGLPETGPKGAKELADRIRARVERARVPMVSGKGDLRLTTSVGVASMPQSASDVGTLVGAADAALYAAKRAGKNVVKVAPDTQSPKASTRGRRAKGRGTTRRK